MSTIEKLSIQGIRSFGSNADDMQSIEFTSPLTLILGENGCGKTTIIECLKYALTGEVPPGSDRGKNFVHDPKIFGLNDCLGQIKLLVRDKIGARLSVSRSMKVCQRRDKISFETMDGTINFLNKADGVPRADSITRRCVDVDVTMCEFMGVSKAIINNVLFCHQEDSSWPLDESKKLKEKFDAIFGITEYNKAIEKIIKLRKEKLEETKVMDANLKLLVHLKQEMEDKSLALQKAQDKCDSIKEQCSQVDEQMKPIENRLLEIQKFEYDMGKFQSQKVELETKHKTCREQVTNLGKKIKNPYTGDLADLENEIRSFDQKMIEKKVECAEVEENLASLNRQEKIAQKSLMELEKKCFVTKQQHQKEVECEKKHAMKIKSLCDQLNIVMSAAAALNTFEGLNDAIEDIQDVLSAKQCEIVETTSANDQEDQKLQAEIDTLRVNVTKTEEGIVSLQKQKDSYEKEIQSTETKINSIELSLHQLKTLTKKIEEADALYESANVNFNKEERREAIAASKATIVQLQDRFQKLDERLTFLNSMTKIVAEIGLKEKELEKKEQDVRKVKNKHSDNFQKVFAQPVNANYRRSLQASYEKLRRDIKELNEKIRSQELKEQSFEIKRKNIKDEIQRFEKELEESKEAVFEKCHSTPYEELLAKSKVALSKYQLEIGALKSADAMYNKYIQKIADEPCCPLCHKNMSGNEAADLTSELTDQIQELPDNIMRADRALKAEQSKYESLIQLRPIIEKVARLEMDIPKRKDELRKIETALSESANEYETIQMLLGEPTLNLELASSMLGDMSLLDEAMKEASRVKKDIDDLKLKLPQEHNTDVSVGDLQTEKSNVAKELEIEREELEINQQTYEKQVESINRLREVKNQLKDQQIKLQEGLQSLPQLKEKQEELTQLIVTTATEINELKLNIQPLKQKLNTAITEKATQKEANRKKMAQMQTKLDAFKSSDQEVQRLNKEVLEFKKMNLGEELKRLTDSITVSKDKHEKLLSDIKKYVEKLEDIKSKCLNQEILERELKDNRELKLLQQKEADLAEQCQSITKQMGDLDFRKVSREKNSLVLKRDEATVRKGELLGQIGEINNQIRKFKVELEAPKYKESVHNYRRAYYESLVTRRICDDLGQYRVAMEWSLIQFHSEKMEKINRLIREYWRLIYRGNDIDYIQIKSDEMDKNTSADRRRNYNYRVIQSKNNSEIEMRGRCSAGQRVLASLIIRMALAETFSSNCGVLALDEPTTNLDRLNIMSLCEALNRIVEERQSKSNFMLLIITHDEEFISTLGKIGSYHRVFRNDECKSVIRKVRIN